MNQTIQPDDIVYEQFKDDEQLPKLKTMIENELSEPYSIYTYRYFIVNYPNMTYMAYYKGEIIGCIIGKLENHGKRIRGYLGMIVVLKQYRRLKIGRKLVDLFIEELKRCDCDEVVLETECDNEAALRLYEYMGFFRDKKLKNYYMNGNDAYRLKLTLTSDEEAERKFNEKHQQQQQQTVN